MDSRNMNFLGFIGLIGAIILVIGAFLGWISYEALGETKSYSGWDIFSNVDSIATGYSPYGLQVAGPMAYSFVALVAVVCGIISLVLMIVPTFANTEKYEKINNILGLIALICSIIVVICGILWYTQSITYLGATKPLTEWYSVGIGFWLVLVGGIITLIGGLTPIIKNKFMK